MILSARVVTGLDRHCMKIYGSDSLHASSRVYVMTSVSVFPGMGCYDHSNGSLHLHMCTYDLCIVSCLLHGALLL